jgi:hypothetical protein
MLKLPTKHSKKWVLVFIALFLLTLVSLISVGKILSINIGAENIAGFALLSAFVSVIISVGGFLGARLYFITASIFDLLGIVYMLYVSINRTAEGWSDLVSIISYLFTLAIGLILGLVIQLVAFLMSKRKRLKKDN